MKKVSALLLTAVLGSSMVFAGISGSVTTKYGYDLDKKTLGFNNDNKDVKAQFELSTENEKISEGDIHAEITASLTIKTKEIRKNGKDTNKKSVAINNSTLWDKDTFDDMKLSAKVVGSNWYVNILGADDLVDYAKDYATDDSDDKETFHNYKFKSSDVQGVTVGYTYEEGKTIKVAVGSDMDFDNDINKNYVAVASPSFMLAKGLTAEAAVALQNNNKDFDFGGGMKVAYANEEADFGLTVAADMGYAKKASTTTTVDAIYELDANTGEIVIKTPSSSTTTFAADPNLDFEVAAKVNYSLATLNAYFATNPTVNTDANAKDAADYTYDAFGNKKGTKTPFVLPVTNLKNLLSVKLDADLGKVIENVPVTMYAQVSGMDATKNTYQMNAGVDYTVAMQNSSLVIGLDGAVRFERTSDWMIGGDVKFTPANNAYVAKAGIKYYNDKSTYFPLITHRQYSGKALKPSVSVETETLVNGATLTAEYTGASLSLEDHGVKKYGAINAKCKIEF